MHSSWAQDRLTVSSQSWNAGHGTPHASRPPTATKMTIVAAPMRKAINHSSRWSSAFIEVLQLRGVEPRLFVDLLDQRFSDARFALAMHLDERFLPGLLLLGAELDDLRLAGGSYLGERVLVLCLRDVVGELGRL